MTFHQRSTKLCFSWDFAKLISQCSICKPNTNHLRPLIQSPYPCLPAYVTPCLRGQCRLHLTPCNKRVDTMNWAGLYFEQRMKYVKVHDSLYITTTTHVLPWGPIETSAGILNVLYCGTSLMQRRLIEEIRYKQLRRGHVSEKKPMTSQRGVFRVVNRVCLRGIQEEAGSAILKWGSALLFLNNIANPQPGSLPRSHRPLAWHNVWRHRTVHGSHVGRDQCNCSSTTL